MSNSAVFLFWVALSAGAVIWILGYWLLNEDVSKGPAWRLHGLMVAAAAAPALLGVRLLAHVRGGEWPMNLETLPGTLASWVVGFGVALYVLVSTGLVWRRWRPRRAHLAGALGALAALPLAIPVAIVDVVLDIGRHGIIR